MIPYSTADLLAQNVTPFWDWNVDEGVKKRYSKDYSNCGAEKARKCRERFKPHVALIKKLRREGVPWSQVSRETGIPKATLHLFWNNNPHLFGD